MKPRHLLLSSSLLLVTALSAQAAFPEIAAESPRQTLVQRSFGPLLRTIDADRDGILSANELQLAPIALTAFDLNEDGFLLRDEINGNSPRGRRPSFQMAFHGELRPSADATLLSVLDANQDGVLQPIELANATSSLRRLDTDGDGALASAELRATGRRLMIARR